jgi:hypothetical protein
MATVLNAAALLGLFQMVPGRDPVSDEGGILPAATPATAISV